MFAVERRGGLTVESSSQIHTGRHHAFSGVTTMGPNGLDRGRGGHHQESGPGIVGRSSIIGSTCEVPRRQEERWNWKMHAAAALAESFLRLHSGVV